MAIPRGTGLITVTIDSKKVENMMTGYQKTLPEGVRLSAKKIASKYAEVYLEQMPKSNIQKWTGRSFVTLRRQINNPIMTSNKPATYAVVVPGTLIALDRMQPHIVALKRGRSITRWAKTKLGFTGKAITVHPHPWINEANRRAGRFVKKIARKEIKKKIVRKGRS